MHVITSGSVEFVLVESDGKFDYVDFANTRNGMVPSIAGDMLQMSTLRMVQGGQTVEATALDYSVDEQCATPDSYLRANGG